MKILPIINKCYYKTNFKSNPKGYFETLKEEREALERTFGKLSSIPEEKTEQRKREIQQSSKQFEAYRQLLEQNILNVTKSDPQNPTKLQQEYFQKISTNKPQKRGFDRISGYEEIKSELNDYFIEAVSKGFVPNTIIIYGPTGCGKSTLARAAAEEANCLVEVIEPNPLKEADIIKQIFQKAKQAKTNFETQNGKRTVLIIDEIEALCPDNPSDKEILLNFLKNCAEDYKCTVFLTTSNPKDLDIEYITPYTANQKFSLRPADKNSIEQIIKDYLKENNKPPVETGNIADRLLSSQEGKYSNKDILDILDLTFLKTECPEERDYLKTIENGEIPPSLTPETLKKFRKDISFIDMF